MAKAKTKKKETVNRDALVFVAEDLNETLGLEPAIPTEEDTSDEEISQGIVANAPEVKKSDDLEEETWAFLKDQGLFGAKKKAGTKKEKGGEKKEKGKKQPPKPRAYKRPNSAGEAIAAHKGETVSIDDLVKEANDLYVEHEGSSNEKESRWALNVTLNALSAMGLVSIEKGEVAINKF